MIPETEEMPQLYGIKNIQKVIVFLVALFLLIAGSVRKKLNLMQKIFQGTALLSTAPDVYVSLKQVTKEASEISPTEQEELNNTIATSFDTSKDKASKIAKIVVDELVNILQKAVLIKTILQEVEPDDVIDVADSAIVLKE